MRIIMLAAKTKPNESLLQTSHYYQFKAFLDKGVIACFSNRKLDLGFASPDIIENRKYFLKKTGVNYEDLVCCQQPHGGGVAIIGKQDIGKGANSFATAVRDCDALITDCANLPLAVFTADCLSLFMFSPKKKVIAVVHAGWRSTKEGITKNTLELMSSRFGVGPKEIMVGLGPAIRSCCYEITQECKDCFQDGVIEKNGKTYLDLVKINSGQLKSMGVLSENIFDCGFCTLCRNDEFFSYRKEGKAAGRMMSLIVFK